MGATGEIEQARAVMARFAFVLGTPAAGEGWFRHKAVLMTSTYLLYDRGRVAFEVPGHWEVLTACDPPAIADVASATSEALAKPIGTRSLAELARSREKVAEAVIVVSDITRAVPNGEFLPAMIAVLIEAGYRRDQIVILIATGMHRPSNAAERVELLGAEIAEHFRVVDHRADAVETLVELPRATGSGMTVRIDKVYLDAELRILTGFIEPHFMAGFSGGRKSICPGLVDLATVQRFHGPAFLGDAKAASGVLDGNPCHREAMDVARMAAADFIFNVTVDGSGKITAIFAGDMEAAHLAGVDFVRTSMTVAIEKPFQAVFASGGGYPLDTTFYQTVKGMVAAGEIVERGGTVILVSGCAEGIGSEDYRRILFEYTDDYGRFIDDIFSGTQVRKDQWELQMQVRVLEKTGREGLIVISDGISAKELRRCTVTPGDDWLGSGTVAGQIQRAVARIADQADRVAILPRGPYILVDHGQAA